MSPGNPPPPPPPRGPSQWRFGCGLREENPRGSLGLPEPVSSTAPSTPGVGPGTFPPVRCLDRRDPLFALAVFAALVGVFGLTFQTRMYGDGPGLLSFFALDGGEAYQHALYLPAMRALGVLLPGASPYLAPALVSVLAGAALGAGSFLLARGLGAPRLAALAGTAVVVLSPGVWFFSTTIEVHALHGAAVAGCACAVLFSPWERAGVALAVAAATFPLVYLTHQTGVLLGPGWVLLVAHARARRAAPFRWRTVLFVVGPVLLAALLATYVISGWLQRGTLEAMPRWQAEFVGTISEFEGPLDFLWPGWIHPLALAIPVALVGAARMRGERVALGALAGLILPSLAFFVWWSVPERGGYMLGTAPFWAALAARGFGSARPWLVGALLVPQLAAARLTIDAWDGRFDPRERARLIEEELGDPPFAAVNAHFATPDIRVHFPQHRDGGLREISLMQQWVREAIDLGWTPERFAAFAADAVALQLTEGPVVFDLAHRELGWHPAIARATPYVEALLAACEERFETRHVEHPDWPLFVVER